MGCGATAGAGEEEGGACPPLARGGAPDLSGTADICSRGEVECWQDLLPWRGEDGGKRERKEGVSVVRGLPGEFCQLRCNPLIGTLHTIVSGVVWVTRLGRGDITFIKQSTIMM